MSSRINNLKAAAKIITGIKRSPTELAQKAKALAAETDIPVSDAITIIMEYMKQKERIAVLMHQGDLPSTKDETPMLNALNEIAENVKELADR